MTESYARARDMALMIMMPLFFSSNLIIGRAAIAEVEPWTLAFFRWFGAAVILLPFVLGPLIRHRRALLSNWGQISWLAILGMWICGALVYLALRYTTATNATLIYTSSPALILILEWLFRGRRIGLRQIFGAVIAFVGVAVIVLKGDLSRLTGLQFNPGDLIIAFCALSWALYSVVLKRPSLQSLPSMTLFTAIVIAGALTLAPFAAWESLVLAAFPASRSAWLSIAGLALVSSVFSFASYQYGVRRFGPSVTGMLLYLLPVYGVGLAIIFLGERFQGFHAAGLGLILPGIILATAPPSSWRRGGKQMPAE
jgi:drug/metabolite transporter (DMT)-like permease